jgi:hypothetical protein
MNSTKGAPKAGNCKHTGTMSAGGSKGRKGTMGTTGGSKPIKGAQGKHLSGVNG